MAFSVSPWERSAEALRFWTTGEWDAAIAPQEQHSPRTPRTRTSSTTSPAPRAAGAIRRRIRAPPRSIELEPSFASSPDDADLDAIRDDARFPAG